MQRHWESGHKHLRGAFTLIELLVVVAIIALLISILLPSLSQAKEQAKTVKCGVNLRSIGQAVAACMEDNNGYGPSWDDGEALGSGNYVMYTWCDTLFDTGYLGNVEAQRCPTDMHPDEVTETMASTTFNQWFVDRFGVDEQIRPGLRTSYTLNGIMHFNFRGDHHKDAARQLYAADGWWCWAGSVNAAWLAAPGFYGFTPAPGSFPVEGGTSIGWRHGRRRAANLLFRDGHVTTVRPTLSGLSERNDVLTKTVDTSRYFTWMPGEHPCRQFSDRYGAGIGGKANPYRMDIEGIDDELPELQEAYDTGGFKYTFPGGRNWHPYAYPEALSAVWRTVNRVWTELPAAPEDRR